MNYAWLTVLVALLAGGCATGRTEFKVIHQERPQPPASAAPVVKEASRPTAVPAFQDQTQANASSGKMIKVTVKAGDTLSGLCLQLLGRARLYPQVAAANQLSNPDLIYPGQVIVFAAGREKGAPSTPAAPTPALVSETVAVSPAASSASPAYPQVEQKAFAPGEKLTFAVEYLGIAAGYATLSVENGMSIENRPTYHLVATARTHPAFEWFYVVRDRIESYMDKQGLFSWRYEKHLREGGYKNDTVLAYRQLEQKVSTLDGKREVEAPAWCQDVLSEFYYFRALPLVPGQTLTIPVLADDLKSYELVVKVQGREKITVPAGTFQCLKVEPFLKFEGLFKHQGQLHIWVTDDQRKVPVLIRSKIVIGSIDIVLRDAVVVEVE